MKKSVFKSKSGQVNYAKARWAPVINCVVRYKDRLLVVQRSRKANFYPGHWNGISGFLDDKKGLEQKVREELNEELGVAKKICAISDSARFFIKKRQSIKKPGLSTPY